MADVGQDGQAAQIGANLAQEFGPFAGESVPWIDSPVTLPPGRDRLATRPPSTGSFARAKTMGMADVACFAAEAALSTVTTTSTLRRTNSSRDLGVALGASFRPAILDRDGAALDPASRPVAARERPTKGAGRAVPVPRNPMAEVGCCALAWSGHAAAPPSNVINSRRLIRSPRRRGRQRTEA